MQKQLKYLSQVSSVGTLYKVAGLASAVLLLGVFQNCSGVHFSTSSPSEAQAISSNPFDANQVVGGVVSGDGYPSENLRVSTLDEAASKFVQDCSKKMPDGTSRFNYERTQALAAAAADPTHKLIPVEFAVSFGTTNDTIALWAHQRAILSDQGDGSRILPTGRSYIPVGDRDGSGYSYQQAYYEVDHTSALNDYRFGKNCFFDVVQVQGDLNVSDQSWVDQADNHEPIYPFISKAIPNSWGVSSIGGTDVLHAIHYMYFGWCDGNSGCNQATDATSAYGAGHYGADMYPNRLFGALPHNEVDQLNSKDVTTGITALPQPQIVKLYVADLRNSQVTNGGALASQSIIPATELHRGQELSEDLKKLIGVDALKMLWRNRDQAIVNLSSDFGTSDPDTKACLNFGGMVGVPQLLSNLTLDAADGSCLAAQYTPIVLDLGDVGVMTSSVFGGTFFNMAAVNDPSVTGDASYDQPHSTAWLGGPLVDVMASSQLAMSARFKNLKSDIGGDHVRTSRLPSAVAHFDEVASQFQHDFRRTAQDGFLVMTDSDGQVRSSRNLFGNETVVNGKSYSNGFLALQALANKDCTSTDPTKRYFGPWDGDLYATKVQVWVDANRNGVVDSGEVKSLEQAKVAAINVCNIVSQQATDAFGNGTSLRSAFLFETGDENIVNDQTEIVKRITTGKTSAGVDATFRLAIDLIFLGDTSKNFFSSDKVVVAPSVNDMSRFFSADKRKLNVNR